ncbi:MAG: sn-glycerol-3-phosphate ABC transporter ATP-binding protein UgpC, partial [Rhodobacterales bacterium]|nr:sn-glycerol-3-phosphate ABC transporter ATP-binding protein UgpC [Rhodobacterales bacterium]MDX5402276.1 sn-glycerol-3-phosphate ABC transporter ATP-binding protein UgpC [Rhodobacterales bacterium]
MAQIAIRALAKRYGQTTAIESLDLTVPSGAFVVILGPSGCGKSTLLRMIAGLEDISAGEIRIGGARVNEVDPGQCGCAMVFQNYALYPHMTVADNIGYGLRVARVPRAEREARVRRVAESLGLIPYLDRRPAQLSGGQRQRVAMGRAMVRSPQVFLFDEPLSNLDAKLRVQMRLEIRRLHRELGTTSVFVTHDQLEAMTMADLLVVMNAGRIEQVGTPAQVFRAPASRFVAGFIGTPAMTMIPATIDTQGGAVADGGWQPCPAGRWDLPAGTRVELGVRPMDVEVLPPGAGGPRFLPDLVEDIGTERHLHAQSDSADLALTL